ncbi:ornithine decarboxylase [Phocoenobacter skyensis]|uniref:ornithine decarboxylase n=1 Tax=Phocoenobacter skyensis TaxID=97481 RepID=A0A1H7ZFI2_9PAST|nr:ornithine decarboxylase [Pasteurella skyensis]MDP8163157.1 ornithine decarboxylase [Pasteurella skyensis]MDP8170128.1 ornithine decarboxylase [Pasteurella skyensis]MDP8173368.1 ornithine decarboxylase [Pasteurella skyensis]MDP8174310.1 ornithine decarboxylase [Pasteurella skyensis]MDP8179540.1 ornithine decarboxylase [Pasteurella skyensis]
MSKHYLKVACSQDLEGLFETEYEKVELRTADFAEVAAIVLTHDDLDFTLNKLESLGGYEIPLFFAVEGDGLVPEEYLSKFTGVFQRETRNHGMYGRQVTSAAQQYEEGVLPPFFRTMKQYYDRGYSAFDCPGHQGGRFFSKHPAGRQFYEFYGENLFRTDLCNADVRLGDLLIHEGPALAAQKHAAKVFNADKTYFVLNGTSASNKVVTSALLSNDDLILFDRNNHKSVQQGALLMGGATPVFLETARNPYGFIGGIDNHCFEEEYIREQIKKVAPEKAQNKRPFRLAVIQLGTYDGTIYNARQVVDRIGHLCDYILFDSAWVGYEQFIPMMRDCSPMLLELNENDPGIIVTQSVHKQQAGFSQSSQIHKKDSHIKGQKRYCDHKRFNNAYMLQASTSPFYAIFASLDINASIHKGRAGQKLWEHCVKVGIEARKQLLKSCELIKPFIPTMVDGKLWQDYPTDMIANDRRFFQFEPNEKWHSFANYGKDQYFVDPCKFLLTTPGINVETGEYEEFGIPATVLANYLRDNGIVPEKCDLNSILFLMTPAESLAKMQSLVAQIAKFERHIKENSLMKDVLPTVYAKNESVYEGYTIRQLCQEMHNFYASNNMKELQKEMFRAHGWPKQAMLPNEAQQYLIRNEVKLVKLSEIEGQIAAEGALPYPPGVLCVMPGEVWGGAAQKYFLALEQGINDLPGFEPEIQGVYLTKEADGSTRAYGYVVDKNS